MSNSENNNDKVVVLEGEQEVLLDHDYDGIKELDHPLPMWWLTIFMLTVVFSIPYYIYYEMLDGPSLIDTMQEDLHQIDEAQASFKAQQGGFDMESYKAVIAAPKAAKRGKKVYKRKCRACHGAEGEGGIGPNLTDNYWLHGDGSVATIYKTVDEGVVDKGMAAWGTTLDKEDVFKVVNYVKSLQGTNPANPKEPQGELIE